MAVDITPYTTQELTEYRVDRGETTDRGEFGHQPVEACRELPYRFIARLPLSIPSALFSMAVGAFHRHGFACTDK